MTVLRRTDLSRAERLTLGVLGSGVAALALSDFVSPVYWLIVALAMLGRWWIGPAMRLSEMQASFIGWFGFLWVLLELFLGRALVIAFTDFLLILALAVTVEAATPRNHLHRMLVGLFLMLAGAVVTDSVLYALPLAAMLWFVWRAAACLYGIGLPGGGLTATPIGQEWPLMLAMAAMTAAIFFTLPRFEFHSLLQPTQPRIELSGFSDSVRLGDFARELDRRVVLRVEAVDEAARDSVMRLMIGRYWRGVVLEQFNGHGWQQRPGRASQPLPASRPLLLSDQGGVQIALYREASDHPYVPMPQGVSAIGPWSERARVDAMGIVRFDRAPARRLRLPMTVASPQALPAMREPIPAERDRSQVPAAVRDWVGRITAGARDKQAALAAVATELKGWRYDLNAAIDQEQPLTSFLARRRGHCELYATALALAARELGFPSHVVNGYLGGEWNDVGHFLLIRQLHAHSWVEVWDGGRWHTMDATPPGRPATEDASSAFERFWESVRMGWYRYVLEFRDSDRMATLLAVWGAFKSMLPWLVATAGLLVLVGRLRRLRFGRHPGRSERLWRRLDRWLLRHGIERQAWQTLRSLPTPDGCDDDRWAAFVRDWEVQAYGDGAAWGRRELARRIGALSKGC